MRYPTLFSLLVVFGLIGCSIDVEDVPITIIVDHKIQPALKDNDSIYKLIEPQEVDSFLLNVIPKFIKIDVSPTLEDSIHIDESLIKRMQGWLGGGKKNSKYFLKTRIKEIQKASLHQNYGIEGDIKYRDSFFNNNKSCDILYSNNDSLIQRYKQFNPSLLVFKSIQSLRNYIITNKNSILSNRDTLKIYFDPKFEQQSVSQPVLIPPNPQSPKPITVVVRKDSKPSPKHINTPTQGQTQKNNECDDPTKQAIVDCKNMHLNQNKVIHFFNRIFRFTKNSECSYSDYLSLLREIYSFILNTPPSFNQGNNTYYNIVCSNRTDFLLELRKYKISVSEQDYNNAFQNCPSNSF
ncbi:MAG: hypothetical protein ACK5BV_05415 [Bacteroidota bacterium]|jgi:hypothetical protein